MKGLEKDMQLTAFLQGVSGLQPLAPKRYQTLKRPVENAIDRYLFSEILVCLRRIAYFSCKQETCKFLMVNRMNG